MGKASLWPMEVERNPVQPVLEANLIFKYLQYLPFVHWSTLQRGYSPTIKIPSFKFHIAGAGNDKKDIFFTSEQHHHGGNIQLLFQWPTVPSHRWSVSGGISMVSQMMTRLRWSGRDIGSKLLATVGLPKKKRPRFQVQLFSILQHTIACISGIQRDMYCIWTGDGTANGTILFNSTGVFVMIRCFDVSFFVKLGRASGFIFRSVVKGSSSRSCIRKISRMIGLDVLEDIRPSTTCLSSARCLNHQQYQMYHPRKSSEHQEGDMCST